MELQLVAGLVVLTAAVLYESWLVHVCLPFSRAPKQMTGGTVDANFPKVFAIARSDCDYGLLWQTQAGLLQLLRSGGKRGITVQEFAEAYEAFSREYPELGDGFVAEDWVGWMQAEGLLNRHEHILTIGDKGVFMLDDMQLNGQSVSEWCCE